jgi:hypothetical protein
MKCGFSACTDCNCVQLTANGIALGRTIDLKSQANAAPKLVCLKKLDR